MIHIKTAEEIEKLRKGGAILSSVLREVATRAVPGASVMALDAYARDLIGKAGGVPAFLGYTPEGISYPYPTALCVSVNDEIVHGIPKEGVTLREGDIVSLDLGLKYEGMFTDMAITVPVGAIPKRVTELIEVTESALMEGIAAARAGNRVGDIGHAIESYVRPYKFGIVRDLAGHGVGKYIHEDPFVPNYGRKGTGEVLRAGMVIAIEPMINEGTDDAHPLEDEYTWVTSDGKRSAHFEKTILITDGDPEILTP